MHGGVRVAIGHVPWRGNAGRGFSLLGFSPLHYNGTTEWFSANNRDLQWYPLQREILWSCSGNPWYAIHSLKSSSEASFPGEVAHEKESQALVSHQHLQHPATHLSNTGYCERIWSVLCPLHWLPADSSKSNSRFLPLFSVFERLGPRNGNKQHWNLERWLQLRTRLFRHSAACHHKERGPSFFFIFLSRVSGTRQNGTVQEQIASYWNLQQAIQKIRNSNNPQISTLKPSTPHPTQPPSPARYPEDQPPSLSQPCFPTAVHMEVFALYLCSTWHSGNLGPGRSSNMNNGRCWE